MADRVLIFSDSLTLPRATPESLLLDETWPFLLRHMLNVYEFVQVTQGGATTTDLINLSKCWLHSSRSPSWLIVQAGIVDCAPRAFTKRELLLRRVLARVTRFFPRVGKAIFEELRRRRKISYVSTQSFRDNIRIFRGLAELHGYSLLWVPVLGASFYEGILPGVSEKIYEANQILCEELDGRVLNVQLLDGHFMSDGHHLKPAGHAILLKEISARLCEESN